MRDVYILIIGYLLGGLSGYVYLKFNNLKLTIKVLESIINKRTYVNKIDMDKIEEENNEMINSIY